MKAQNASKSLVRGRGNWTAPQTVPFPCAPSPKTKLGRLHKRLAPPARVRAIACSRFVSPSPKNRSTPNPLPFPCVKKNFLPSPNEGHYLLRSHLSGQDPAIRWQHYIQLTEIEAVFHNLKGDLALRLP